MTDNTKNILTVVCIIILLVIASLYLVIRSESTKITTFEECEKAGWLVRSITVYDGPLGSPEKECELWGGKSFIKQGVVQSDNVNVSSVPFFPMQKEPATSYMLALLSDKPEELTIKDGCLRAGGYLLVWPYGYSLSTDGEVIQIIDDNGQPIMRVGDKIKLGGGEMPSERIAQYSAELPSDRCSGPYWIIGEVITVDKSTSPVATTPTLKSAPSQYFSGQAFDEASGILTKKWDAENFKGFWRDSDTGASTEALIINQSILNNSYRRIERHNLIYSTKSIPLKYQVYARVNKTPTGTEGFYPAIGWLGEKYVFLDGNRIARVIFEQNASEAKPIEPGDTWSFGEGYRIVINSVEHKTGPPQSWIVFLDGNNADNVIFVDYYVYTYPGASNESIPVFITYLPEIRKQELRYTWLRSQNIIQIKDGDIFGVVEVTSVKNGTIELRNKEPIDLAPGNIIHLMGNISIQVGSSKTGLLFYPLKGGI